MKTTLLLASIMLLLGGCAFRSLSDTVESIYTDEEVVKPTAANYKIPPLTSKKPILKEEHITPSQKEKAKAISLRLKTKGYIQSFTYDPDIKLYVYNFTTESGDQIIFFYNQKLSYANNDLIEVDIKDNYLKSAQPAIKSLNPKQLTPAKKRKLIIKKRRKSKIHEAIEEKINTL